MTIVTVHANSAISKNTTFQRSVLGAILDTDFLYTESSSELVLLASPDPDGPQYGFIGRNLAVDPDGTLHGIVERIEIFKNAAAVNPSVIHLLEGEQLLADLDFSARLGSGPLASQNYAAFYQKLGSFGTDHEIQGSNGNDILEPLFNTSLVKGFNGNDTFLFYGGVTYHGGKGYDVLDISASGRKVGVDLSQNLASDGNISTLISIEGVIGTKQDDNITGNKKNNIILGDDGKDLIVGLDGDDRLVGGNDADDIYGGDGDDVIFANSGDDTVKGGNGNDDIRGGSGIDGLKGGAGEDTIHGGSGNDIVEGGQDADSLFGDDDDDKVYGQGAGDIINGNDGDDELYGGAGNDELIGGRNRDLLVGGLGDDTLYGLGGRDTFMFSFLENGNDTIIEIGNDTIMDFEKGKDTLSILALTSNVTVEQIGADTIIRIVSGVSGSDISVIEVQNVSLTIFDINFL